MIEQNLFLGETCGFWIQTGAIIVSAGVAILAIYHNGKMAKLRATIDVIMQDNHDEALRKAKTTIFTEFKDISLIDIYKNNNVEHKIMLLMLLNKYEFIAHGIRMEAFDEEIYKSMQYSSIMKMREMSKPLIEEIRRVKKIKTLYQEFEWLAKRWEKKPLKKN